jgi:serine/threonine protein phosphatase PrpC
MEDAFEIYSPSGQNSQFMAFGVYDGHGGDNVAIKASKYCIKDICEEKGFKEAANWEGEGSKVRVIAAYDGCNIRRWQRYHRGIN